MKVYRAIDNGNKMTVQEHKGAFGYNNKTEKSIEKLSGEGDWRHLHGVKLQVDPSGVIIKGPDIFCGRKWDDVKRLNYSDTFNVMRSVARAVGETNKAYEDKIDKANRKKAMKESIALVDSLIKAHVDAEIERDRYRYPSGK